MTPAEAATLLDLPVTASPEQLEARFQELRAKLEDKIAKAPTPGLKAKYRESLDEITIAFETLTLAADSSALPVIQKQGAGSKEQGVQSSRSQDNDTAFSPSSKLPAPSSSRPKSGGKEFALVAAIAVIVLAGGGWFVMKTRAENAEKARLAAEQKAEAERKAEEARVAAEAKKKADEEEKIRTAAVAKAEAERLDKVGAQVRIILAEAKLQWEQIEKQERDAERDLSELKQELKAEQNRVATSERSNQSQSKSVETAQADYEQKYQQHNDKVLSLQRRKEQAEARRDSAAAEQAYEDIRQEESNWNIFQRQYKVAQAALDNQSQSNPAGDRRNELTARITALSEYVQWLSDFISTHPVKSTQVRATEFLNSRLINEASQTAATLNDLLTSAKREIAARKPKEDDLYGSVVIVTDPAGIPWKLADAFGNFMSGRSPGTATRVAAGPATITFRRPGWEDQTVTAQVPARKEARAEFTYRAAALTVTTQPAGAQVLLQGKVVGQTPLTLSDLPIREQVIEVRLAEHKSRSEKVSLQPGKTTEVKFELSRLSDREFLADFTTRWAGTWVGTSQRGNQFSCRLEAGSTVSVESILSGKNASRAPNLVNLELSTRQPVVVSRYVNLNGYKFVIGHFAEENGTLVYYQSAGENVGRTSRVDLQRTSN